MLFDWAAQPFSTLVITFLFGPYFVTVLIGDPVWGQQIWFYTIAVMGIFIAFAAPIVGRSFDRTHHHKIILAGLSLIYVVGMSGLFLAAPGRVDLLIPILVCLVAGGVAIEVATVLTNAYLPRLAEREQIGRLSAKGWAVGYAGGIVSLLFLLCCVMPVPGQQSTLIGITPLVPSTNEDRLADRLIGPFSAFWYLAFVWPAFYWLPKRPRTPLNDSKAQADPFWKGLWQQISSLRHRNDLRFFLLANLFVKDGMIALFALGGIFGAGLFGWGVPELAIFGIGALLMGTLGASVSGYLDDRFGFRRVILASLLVWLVAGFIMLGLAPDRIFFVIVVAAPTPTGFLDAPAEQAFMMAALLVGLMAGPLQASFRSGIVHLSPPEHMGQHFGLLALSGRSTAFVGQLAAGAITGLTGQQQSAVLVVLVLLTIGLFYLLRMSPSATSPAS